MLMDGKGPIGTLRTDGGKVFAGMYELYCGSIELVAIGILQPQSCIVPTSFSFGKLKFCLKVIMALVNVF